MLLLPGMGVAAPVPSADGSLYIASSSDGGIRQLKPVPLEKQARLLAAAGDFQAALELLTLLDDDQLEADQAAGMGRARVGPLGSTVSGIRSMRTEC